MEWINLETHEQLADIKRAAGYSLIFKHSTRCSISMMAKRKFELDREVIPETTPTYFLDLIRYRSISNEIAELFSVAHESPQLLLIRDGECVYEMSHGEISADDAVAMIA